MARKELHSTDVPQPEMDDIVMPALDQAIEHDSEIVTPNLEQINKDYLAALAFNEEPISIRIEPSSEENPPLYIDCWVQGKGCELFENGRWTPVGAFPVGQILVTRRKYVEALAMAKRIMVRTAIINPGAERPENRVTRTVSQRAVFSIVKDRNPRGKDWARSVLGLF